MKSFIFFVSVFVGFLVLLLATAGVAIALFGPFHPGNLFFPIQDFAEQKLTIIYRDPVNRSNYLLDLVERRMDDLSISSGTSQLHTSIEYLDKAIDQATLAISSVELNQADILRNRLISFARQINDELPQLSQDTLGDKHTLDAFVAKIQVLMRMAGTSDNITSERTLLPAIIPNSQNQHTTVHRQSSATGLIPFPMGSKGSLHNFYPLLGRHASLACESCHNSGKYAGIPNLCIQCHAVNTPEPHYSVACDLCHTSVSWTDIHFDHASVASTACRTCHEKDLPGNHYNGACSACHNTQAWNIVTFDHLVAGAVDCISCHSTEEPVNHYQGQCSNCHNTTNWSSVVFNHTGFTDCVSCHRGEAPANHYSGQCSNCHETNGSWTNAHFNHSGYTDCVACHAGSAPGNHYSGQCSNCHDTNGWGGASFNHSGYTDCVACHAGDAPGNHYPGQCSNCHNTNGWGGASFNHAGFTDCLSCHQKDRPREHDSGQCSECHNTHSWEGGDDNLDPGLNQIITTQIVNCSVCHSQSSLSISRDIKQ